MMMTNRARPMAGAGGLVEMSYPHAEADSPSPLPPLPGRLASPLAIPYHPFTDAIRHVHGERERGGDGGRGVGVRRREHPRTPAGRRARRAVARPRTHA